MVHQLRHLLTAWVQSLEPTQRKEKSNPVCVPCTVVHAHTCAHMCTHIYTPQTNKWLKKKDCQTECCKGFLSIEHVHTATAAGSTFGKFANALKQFLDEPATQLLGANSEKRKTQEHNRLLF